MSILVVCPGCKKSFRVSDQFAGRKGPCPNCKTLITVPAKSAEVKVHGPEEFASGGRTVSGELATKPLPKEMAKFDPVVAGIIAAACLVVLTLAWLGGRIGLFRGNPVTCALGLAVVTPPLVIAAYSFLRNDELQPFRGMALYIRAGICSLCYIVLWGAFAWVAGSGWLTSEIISWLVVAPPFFIVGMLVAHSSLDLDMANGLFHYTFYLLVTMLLGWVAGVGWVWEAAQPATI